MPAVTLALVDDHVLARLTQVAVSDAAADEVTPSLSGEDTWTPERVAWFEEYHRSCWDGLDGPAGEAAWAIVADGSPVGCIRLKLTDEPGVLETGIWLARSARGRGISVAALRAVVDEADRLGAGAIRADTASTNLAAQATLRRIGFDLTGAASNGRVSGRLNLRAGSAGTT